MKVALLSLVVVAGCGSKKQEEPAASAPPPPPPPPPPAAVMKPAPAPVEPAPDLGSCTIEASGTVTATSKAPGGLMAASAAAWFTDAERKDGKHIERGVIINCNGNEARLSITDTEEVPFGPRSYDLAAKGSPVRVLGSINGHAFLGKRSGKLDIVEFDARHIAGTLDLTTSMDLAGKQPETIKATFDFACPTCR